jgi:hypothetical protein
MTAEERKKRLLEIEEERMILEAEQDLKNVKSSLTRARSITVGTAFGGVTEVSMRGDGGDFLWCLLQPVEVTELIHQLASNIGCHIVIQPRRDFASWRDWKVSDEERLRLNGWAPFPNDMAEHLKVGNNMPVPDLQPGLSVKKDIEIEISNESLAIEKPVNKRKSKRAPAPPG